MARTLSSSTENSTDACLEYKVRFLQRDGGDLLPFSIIELAIFSYSGASKVVVTTWKAGILLTNVV